MQPTILVIEQNEITAKILRMTLADEEYRVIEATDTNAAFEFMAKNKPDLILQDASLAGGDCVEITQQLHNVPGCSQVPIILMSGFLSKVAKNNFIKTESYVAFLIKPIEPGHLLETVKKSLSSQPTMDYHQAQGELILVVDDEPSLLELLSLNLESIGFKVEKASNGQEALKKLAKITPSAIVSDIIMPGMDGFEFCLKVRADEKARNVPVILISSHYLEEADNSLAQKVGATSLITRTQDLDKNIAAVVLSKLKKSPARPVHESLEALQKEHNYRVLSQLEKQVRINAELGNRCALQTTKLFCVQKITGMLLQERQEKDVLKDILATGLDAAGIPVGILYLRDAKGEFYLQQMIGIPADKHKQAEHFFNAEKILKQAAETNAPLEITLINAKQEEIRSLFSMIGVEYGLVLPLVIERNCFGVLFLGAHTAEIIEADSQKFASLLCLQLVEGIQFTKIVSRLRASEHRYHTLMNQAGSGIVILNKNLVVQEANVYAEKIFGLAASDLVDRHFPELLSGEHRAIFIDKMDILPAQEILRIEEISIAKKDKKTLNIEMSIAKISVENEELILVVLDDITEINKLRHQSLLSDRLAVTGTLAAGIAHEINNPAAYVFANLYFVQSAVQKLREMSDELGIDQQNLLDEIDESMHQSMFGITAIRDIVNSLKGFTRVDGKILEISNLHEMIDAAIKLIAHKIRYHAVLEKDYTEALPAFMGIPGKLQQLFVNLLMNALQAIPTGSPEKNKITIKTYVTADNLGIDISDTGSGIPSHILPFIFDPFFTTKPVGAGTGLGLPICYDIVTEHHGKIMAKSDETGTTMTVLLPLKRNAKPHKPVPTVKKRVKIDGRMLRLLVVDDDPLLLQAMQRMLGEDYEIVPALGGQAALDILANKQEVFDIIITDLFMPGLSGIDLYYMIKKMNRHLEERMLFITGGAFTEEAKTFLAEIKNPQLEKPFKIEELFQKIDQVLSVSGAAK